MRDICRNSNYVPFFSDAFQFADVILRKGSSLFSVVVSWHMTKTSANTTGFKITLVSQMTNNISKTYYIGVIKTNYSYEMSETAPGETYVANIVVFGANWCIFLSNKSNAYTTGKEYPENGFLDDSASPFYTWHKNEVYCLHRSTSAQWCRSWDAGISNSTPKVFWFVKNLGKIRKNLCKEFWYFLTILN